MALRKLCQVLPTDVDRTSGMTGMAPRGARVQGPEKVKISNIDPDSHMDVDEMEKHAGIYSSMDSTAWRTHVTHSGPLPPDRRLHERHVSRIDQLWEDVALAPHSFEEMVTSRRSNSSQPGIEISAPLLG